MASFDSTESCIEEAEKAWEDMIAAREREQALTEAKRELEIAKAALAEEKRALERERAALAEERRELERARERMEAELAERREAGGPSRRVKRKKKEMLALPPPNLFNQLIADPKALDVLPDDALYNHLSFERHGQGKEPINDLLSSIHINPNILSHPTHYSDAFLELKAHNQPIFSAIEHSPTIPAPLQLFHMVRKFHG
ncbi:MAG: hypothetical protein Q9227_008079 [Pyrenula ochraceoflavens]